MNLGKSIKIACALNDMTQGEAAEKANVLQPQLSLITRTNSCQSATLEKMAKAFKLKVSEFIALGE